MFVGVEKSLFGKHGIDMRRKLVNTVIDMANAMKGYAVQIGDMHVTTFLKARHDDSPFPVVGSITRGASTTSADDPLTIYEDLP
jgi:hypothetical protein